MGGLRHFSGAQRLRHTVHMHDSPRLSCCFVASRHTLLLHAVRYHRRCVAHSSASSTNAQRIGFIASIT